MTEKVTNEVEECFGGTKIVKTKVGDIEVRELKIDDIILVTNELLEIFDRVPKEELFDVSNVRFMVKLCTKYGLLDSFKRILRSVCRVAQSPLGDNAFDELSLLDTVKVMVAFFKVNSLQELRETFFALAATLGLDPKNLVLKEQ